MIKLLFDCSENLKSHLNITLSSLIRFVFGLAFFLSLTCKQLMAREIQTSGQTTPFPENHLVISGQIISNGEPAPFAKVILYSEQTPLAGVLTDLDGYYRLHVSDSLLHSDLRMVFSCVCHTDQELCFNPVGLSALSINQDLTASRLNCIIFQD